MTKEEWAKWNRKMQLNSIYGTNLCKEIMAPKDQALTAIQNAWAAWRDDIKHDVTDFGFRDWCKRVHGFEYRQTSDRGVATTVLDEQKYAWFLLKWA
jgi:uncharacterized protein YecT (DUF1311 family)